VRRTSAIISNKEEDKWAILGGVPSTENSIKMPSYSRGGGDNAKKGESKRRVLSAVQPWN